MMQPAPCVDSSAGKIFRSVGALIIDVQGRMLLQRRDTKTSIYFPGLWGVFGGSCEGSETPEAAIVREIREELSIGVSAVKLFLRWTINCPELGEDQRDRYFFSVLFDPSMVEAIRLGEGQEFRFFAVNDLPRVSEIVPFDLAAVSMFSHARVLGSQIRPRP